MELTAYHRYLLRESKCDRKHLAVLLYLDVVKDQNKMAFELLEKTGDKHFTEQTFLKVADNLIIESNKQNIDNDGRES